jgi:transcriptional regulator with XRE-family HTH domain
VDRRGWSPLGRAVLAASGSVTAYEHRLLLGASRFAADAATATTGGFTIVDPTVLAAGDAAVAERGVLVADPAAWPAVAPGEQGLLESAIARQVLRLGLVAHWFIAEADVEGLHAGMLELAQCVIRVARDELVLDRADARGPSTLGAGFRYVVGEDEGLTLSATPAAARLGRGLVGIRRDRGWSQADLARVAGVSPSAISQAERGRHALSLGTLLDLSGKLGITIDDLVRGRPAPYTVVRSDGFAQGPGTHSQVLLENSALGLRTTLVRIPPRGSASLVGADGSPQLVLVGHGLVQVVLKPARPVLREGDVLEVPQGGIQSCRNVGDRDALVFFASRRRDG